MRLDNKSCEVLEAVLSRMQMSTLDLERTNLEDEVCVATFHVCLLRVSSNSASLHLPLQGAIALCEMIEFYGCSSKLVLASNNKLRPRAWLTIGRTLKKVCVRRGALEI